MYNKEKLESILQEDILSIEETSYGITNKNYIITTTNNKYFYRVAKDTTSIVSKENEPEAIELLKNENYFLKPIFYNNNNLITKYQKNSKTFISQKSLSSIVQIAKLLKEFHSKKFITKNSFNPIVTFENYLQQVEDFNMDISHFIYVVDELKKVYTPDRLCHNDLVEGNFLFTKEKLYLIDFEYAGLNDYYFDIASFISEKNLDYQESLTFLQAYFTDENVISKNLIFSYDSAIYYGILGQLSYMKNVKKKYTKISLMINITI